MSCYLSWRCLFLVLGTLNSMFLSCSGCFMDERAALMDISSWFMGVQYMVPTSWGGDDDCCSWERVTCNSSTRRISHLDLSQDLTQYSPSMEDEISNLNLKIFSSFRELQLLDFSAQEANLQNFEGLQGLSKLKYLDLSDNQLFGGIPRSIGRLVSLEAINLNRNNMGGALQNIGFQNLRNLRELHLRSNRLSGSLPASLFALPFLEHLDLSENLFEGHIPINSSWNCSSLLKTIRLSDNKLSGTFDFFWIRNCTKLKEIDLSRNTDLVVQVKMHGWVPKFRLRALKLSWCNLDKSIITEPHFLRTQHRLKFLDLSNNNLPGSMPSWLWTNEVTLTYLNLANNLLVGSLDLIWQHQTNLKLVNISPNLVEGQLPANISLMFPNLVVLDVSHNIISGTIPPSLCHMSNLSVMDLSNNKFTGKVPSCLFTDCHSLDILKLSNNTLGGKIFDGASSFSADLWGIYLDNKFVVVMIHFSPLNLRNEITFFALLYCTCQQVSTHENAVCQ
ncbi:receptor-like protein 13 [Triticum aestivum]|uniref:receptor-like protein 13 n=1 Tax=Triticum aestivum TaxID=4565 RepID=UPI001D034109|nr:receptor-like protein 13 [Triticum aestivum]